MTLAYLNARSAGWPLGGSLEFAKRMEQKYTSLGGRIKYKTKVKKIIVSGKKATGVLLENGETINADIVISAADGHSTLFNMLDGKYMDRKTRNSYKSEVVSDSTLQLSFGVNMDFSNEPHNMTIPLGEKNSLGGDETDILMVKHYCYDKSMAPEGKSTVICLLAGKYEWWQQFVNDKEGYNKAKEEIKSRVIKIVEKRFPGFEKAIEVSDVATPLTFSRYTDNWKGSIMGWATKTGSLSKRRKRIMPGIKNFYMAGQWAETNGGLPPAVLSGRQIIQVICKRDKKVFSVNNKS